MMKFLTASAMVAALAVLAPTVALCLDAPAEKVVLTIRGKIRNANVGDTAQFDIPMLEKLAGRTATVETPWMKGVSNFSGPFLRSVLEAVGATGTTMKVRAINDYSSEVPVGDAEMDVILATRHGGKLMSLRDKGPLFLIYPFDLDGNLYNEKYFNRSVWQIDEIEVQ